VATRRQSALPRCGSWVLANVAAIAA
jgi:hypothetical protein